MKLDLDDKDMEKFAYVTISSYRIKTIMSLEGGRLEIPSGISKRAGVRVSHMSKVLNDLKEAGIVECLNENAHKGRLYRLTELGEDIARNLKNNDMDDSF